ncbi:GSCOCG00011866001-RA-CDS [Cotesia congregata]|nr:GSCOCG00011866001-RA-CDS [Cotesia congregata]
MASLLSSVTTSEVVLTEVSTDLDQSLALTFNQSYQILPLQYQDLESFLLNCRPDGPVILFHYEHHKSLSDIMLNHLARLVVGREIDMIFQAENVSLSNPLKKLEIPSKNLKQLAGEISVLFKERSDTFYTPGHSDKDHRVGPSGKLIARVNYMRKILVDCGVLKLERRSSLDSQIPLDSEDKLTILKENTAEWTIIEQTWRDTFLLRQQLIKQKAEKGLWEFSEFLCLAASDGASLLIQDFNTKYPDNNIKIKEIWKTLQNALDSFIYSKKLSNEVQDIFEIFKSSKENQHDAIVLMLLPFAIKAPALSTKGSSKPPTKKQKVEEPKSSKSTKTEPQKTFILHVNIAADVDKKIDEERESLLLIKERVQPFMVFVGPLTSLEAFYVVVDKVRYKSESALEALDLTFRIFFACNCDYPKLTQQTWLFIQKLLYRINVPGDKCSMLLNKALTFFEKALNIKID